MIRAVPLLEGPASNAATPGPCLVGHSV